MLKSVSCLCCSCILLEPIWILPNRQSPLGSSACSGSCDHCSQTVSQTLSDRWCWPQRCLTGPRGQIVHLDRGNILSLTALDFGVQYFCVFCQPLSFSIASSRYRLSSQMLCSMELLAKPKVRNMAMAKRRCLLHTFPLLKNRPADTENKAYSARLTTTVLMNHSPVIYLSSPNKFCPPLGCKADPQSCQPVSLKLPSPSSSQTKTQFCVFPDVCRTHSHKHQPAVDEGE